MKKIRGSNDVVQRHFQNIILILFSICTFLFITCSNKTNQTLTYHYTHIDSLIRSKQFFKACQYALSHNAEFSDLDSTAITALLDHAFNRPADAITKMEHLLNDTNYNLPDSIKVNFLNILQMNHGKLGQYKQAYDCTSDLINYSSTLTIKEMEDYKNMHKIWNSLKDQPPQEITVDNTVRIQMKRDKLGLQNLPVSNGHVDFDFIFDTGANLSTITESVAKNWNLKLSDSVIKVRSITGTNVNAHIAVCENLIIDAILAKNVVFIVFPDSALFIEQVPYQINGILGFPLFNALGEIQITKKDEFIVPLHATKSILKNMALDFLTPVLEIDGDSYTFDSGANTTMLYQPYYKKYKSRIDSHYVLQNLNITGAGGEKSKKGYVINYETTISEKKVRLDSIDLFVDEIKQSGEHYFGNIGQDFIAQFDTMILNFKEMFIQFK